MAYDEDVMEDDGFHNSVSKARPKTSHVSGRRRWIPEADEDQRPEYKDEFVPPSPSLRPMTSIYRYSLHMERRTVILQSKFLGRRGKWV